MAAPAPAAAFGYNIQTYGPSVTVGSNWRVIAGGVSYVQNGDGSVTLSGGPNTWNEHIITGIPSGQGSGVTGAAFGGGGYFEATLFWQGTATTAGGGWPAWWSDGIELKIDLATGNGIATWPGQASDYKNSVEVDFMEAFNGGEYGGQIHNWYATPSYSRVSADGPGADNGSPFPMPGINFAQPHTYGFLWVPATASAQGQARWYFDNVQVGNTVRWNQYNPSIGPPPVRGTSAFSVMDVTHRYLILGTGPNNPMTVTAVNVWQNASANNIGSALPPPGPPPPPPGPPPPPPGPPPPPTSSPPIPAAAVGYNTQTFGPNVTIGSNWSRFASDVDVTQNTDGTVTIRGGNNNYGQQIQTALPTSSTTWSGSVFSGGAYFEATMFFTGAPSVTGGWPSFWLQDIEMAANNGSGSLAHWQGQAAAFNRWSTVNIAEWADDHVGMSNPRWVFHNFHDYYGVVDGSQQDVDVGYHLNSSPYLLPTAFNLAQPHRYGFLWVPATASTQGYGKWFIDDVEVSSTACVWNQYNPATNPPPVKGTTAWSFIDARHMFMTLGSGPNNPLTVTAVNVWQNTGTPPPPPPPPISSQEFTVSWNAPTTGAPILQYQTEHRAIPSQTWIPNPAGATTLLTQKILNLVSSTTYEVRIHVWNAYGSNYSLVERGTTSSGFGDPIVLAARDPDRTLTDSSSVTWKITPHGQIYQDGTYETDTQAVTYFAFYNGTLFQLNDLGDWWSKPPAPARNNAPWTFLGQNNPLPPNRAQRAWGITRLFGMNISDAYTPGTPAAANYVAAMRYLGIKRFRVQCADTGSRLTNDRVEALCADGCKGTFQVFPRGYIAPSQATANSIAANNVAQQITRVGISGIHSFQVIDVPAASNLTAAQVQTLCFALRDAVAARGDTNRIIPTVGIDQYYLQNMTTVLNYATGIGDTGLDWGSWQGIVNIIGSGQGIAVQPYGAPNGPVAARAHTAILEPYRRTIVDWMGVNRPGISVGAMIATARAGAMIEMNYLLDACYLDMALVHLSELFDNAAGYGHFATAAAAGTITVNMGGTLVFPYPAAVALHNLTTILEDTGANAATFIQGSLPYTVTGLPVDGRIMLAQKSDGRFVIIAWNEPQIQSQTLPVTDLVVNGAQVTITFGDPVISATVYDPVFGTTAQRQFDPSPPNTTISSCFFTLVGGPQIVLITPA